MPPEQAQVCGEWGCWCSLWEEAGDYEGGDELGKGEREAQVVGRRQGRKVGRRGIFLLN